MKVLVCGGRDFNDRELLFKTLDRLHRANPITLVIHGGARGADALGDQWADAEFVECKAFQADWDTHGKAAGPIRNSQMLQEKPDLVVACPGGPGTADMVRKARAAGVAVLEVEHAE